MIFFTNNELHKAFGLKVKGDLTPPDEKQYQAKYEEIRMLREAASLKTAAAANVKASHGSSSGNKAATHVTTRPTSIGQRNAGPPSQVQATTGPGIQASSSGNKATHVDTRPTTPGQRNAGTGTPSQVHRFQAATTGPGIQASTRPEASQSNAGPKAGQPQLGTVEASTTTTSSGKKAVAHVTTKPSDPSPAGQNADPQVQAATTNEASRSWSRAVSRPVNTKPSGPSPGQNADPQVQAATTNVQAWSKAVSRPVGNANAGPQAGTVQAPGNNAMTPGPETTPNALASFNDPIHNPIPKVIHDGFGRDLVDPDPIHAKFQKQIHNGFGHELREEGAKKEVQKVTVT